MPHRRFHNYVQMPLAELLLRAKLGEKRDAVRLLESFVESYEVPDAAAAALRRHVEAI